MLTDSIKNSSLREAAQVLGNGDHMPWCEAINRLDDRASEAAVALALVHDAKEALSVIAAIQLAGELAVITSAKVLKRPNKTTIAGFQHPIYNRRLRKAFRALRQVGLRPYTVETAVLLASASDHEIATALATDAGNALHGLDTFQQAAQQALLVAYKVLEVS